MARITITQWVQNQLTMMVKKWKFCVDATAGKGNDTLFLCENSEAGGKVFAFDIQKSALDATRELLEKNDIHVVAYENGRAVGTEENVSVYKNVNMGEVKTEKNVTVDENMDAKKVQLIWDGHENMDRYIQKETVDVMMFNLGYLPGGDHSLATTPITTIEAIQKGLTFLKKDGVMSICIYSGGDSGFEERDAVLDFLKELDSRAYTVIVSRFFNKPNHPPIPVFIIKNERNR